MRTLRFATTTVVILSLWFASAALADPDANHGTSRLTDPILLALIGNDDVFSTADLTMLLDPPWSERYAALWAVSERLHGLRNLWNRLGA